MATRVGGYAENRTATVATYTAPALIASGSAHTVSIHFRTMPSRPVPVRRTLATSKRPISRLPNDDALRHRG